MEESCPIAVGREAGNNLKFPGKCAYCFERTIHPHYLIVKHKELKGYKLKVPYCETHSRMFRYLKVAHYASFAFALFVTVLIARYLHNHRVFVVGNTGFNYLVAAVFLFPVWFPVIFLLRILVLRHFAGAPSVDHVGAVQIDRVCADGFILLFYNVSFAREFNQLNHLPPLEISQR